MKTFCILPLLFLSGFYQSPPFSEGRPSYQSRLQLDIDHVNLAVGQLEEAGDLFRKLGFTIKSGRLHGNTLNNLHIKFRDGRELELITASEPADELAEEYLELIYRGDGGAFCALRSENLAMITKFLGKGDYRHIISKSRLLNSITFPRNSDLRPVWFVDYNMTITDEDSVLSHENGAEGLEAVWISSTIEDSVLTLFKDLGYNHRESVNPFGISVELKLNSSSVYFVSPLKTNVARAVSGVTIIVPDIGQVTSILTRSGIAFETGNDIRGRNVVLNPDICFGIWVEFLEKGQKK